MFGLALSHAFLVGILVIIIKTKVLHYLEEFLHKDRSVKFWLAKHLKQALNLSTIQVINPQSFDRLNQPLRRNQFVLITVDLRWEDVPLQQRAHCDLLLNDLVSNLNEDFLSDVDHFIFIHFKGLLCRVDTFKIVFVIII